MIQVKMGGGNASPTLKELVMFKEALTASVVIFILSSAESIVDIICRLFGV